MERGRSAEGTKERKEEGAVTGRGRGERGESEGGSEAERDDSPGESLLARNSSSIPCRIPPRDRDNC